jgi:hypothetical protein
VPPLCPPLGLQGQRPLGGTWDHKEQGDCCAALTRVPGPLTPRFLEHPPRSKVPLGQNKPQRVPRAFVAHRCEVARRYPARLSPEVVITIDQAPWQRGAGVEPVGAAHPQLHVERLPRSRPQLNMMERFGRVRRRRATQNRLFSSMAAWRTTRRNNLSYCQTLKQKGLSWIQSVRRAKKEAKLSAA